MTLILAMILWYDIKRTGNKNENKQVDYTLTFLRSFTFKIHLNIIHLNSSNIFYCLLSTFLRA